MAGKDTSIARERLLNKQKEFENIKRDIYSILEDLTDNVTRATQTFLDKSVTNNRRQFRFIYAKADQTIEACLLKLMDARADLQNDSDDETGSDHIEDVDGQSSISSDIIKPPEPASPIFSSVDCVLQRSLINDRFAQNCTTSSMESKCDSPTLLSSTQQPHILATIPTEVVLSTNDNALNMEKGKDFQSNFNSLLPSQEPTKEAASLNDFVDCQCAVSSEECKSVLPLQSSMTANQTLNYLEQDDSSSEFHSAISDDSKAVITNSELKSEDACSSVRTGYGMMTGHMLFSNHAAKYPEGLAHQFKDLNLDKLVNTLAHLTEPKDSGGSPETELFQKHVQNIYKHVAPNISRAIDKFNPSSLMTIHKLDQDQGTASPPVAALRKFSPISKPNLANNCPAFGTTFSTFPSSSVSNTAYNFKPFTNNNATTFPNFCGSIMSHADQKTDDPKNAKEMKIDVSGRHAISQSFPVVNGDAFTVQEISFPDKVTLGLSPILNSSDCVPQVIGMSGAAFKERVVSPSPVDSDYSDSAVPLSLPRLQFDDGSVIIATVEHINSPSSFYMSPRSTTVSLEALTAQLSKYYDGSYHELFTEKAAVGLVCCALSYNDNNWYRAVITTIHQPQSSEYHDATVTVRFVDKGVTETLPLFRLRRLSESFFATPCLVVHCSLFNAKPPLDQTEWTDEQIDTFINLACRNDVKAKVHGKLVTGELDVDLMTLEKYGSETVEVSILDCFINAACCCKNVSNTSFETPRASPVQTVPDEKLNSKICFTINEKKNPLLELFQKKKVGSRKVKKKRLYRTARANNEASCSDDDPTSSAPTLKPPLCWEDLDSHSSSSTVEKEVENVSNNKMNIRSPPSSSPFPTLRNIELNLSDYSVQDAMLAHVVSPSEFYIHPVVEEATYIDDLCTDLNKTYAKAQAPLAIVDKQLIPKGSFWCAKFPENGSWYRAKILDIKEIEDPIEKHESKKKKKKLKTKPTPLESKFKVHVFYVDHGDSAWIGSSDLRHLKKKFYKYPALAVRCSLMSVFPKCDISKIKDESTQVWPPEAGKALQSWGGDKVIRIQVFSAKDYDKTGEFQVLLWDLENEKCLFNEEIVKCGLADSNIYCKDKKLDSLKAGNQNNDDCVNLSLWDPMTSDFQDMRNSYAVDVDDAGVALTGYKARDEYEICMFYQRGQLCKRGSNCRYKHIQPPLDGQTSDSKAVACSNDLVSLPSISSCVAVDITAIVNAAHFYVNFPYSSKPLSKLKEEADCEMAPTESENLIILQTKLQKAYKNKFPRDGDYLLRAEGEIVVARFALDNAWYRARVTCVDPERSMVKVFYVDYGNCEWVSEINVRDIRPEFMHFPFQAVECRLANIELFASDDESRKDAKAFFQQQIENRNLVAHIKDIIGNILYLELFYTENETDVNVNWTLVSMDYATYSRSGMVPTSSSTSKKVNIMPV